MKSENDGPSRNYGSTTKHLFPVSKTSVNAISNRGRSQLNPHVLKNLDNTVILKSNSPGPARSIIYSMHKQ